MGRTNRLEVHPRVRGHSVDSGPQSVNNWFKSALGNFGKRQCLSSWVSSAIVVRIRICRSDTQGQGPTLDRPCRSLSRKAISFLQPLGARSEPERDWPIGNSNALTQRVDSEESVRSDRGRNGRPGRHPRVRVHPAEKARGLLSIDLERAAGVGASLKAHFSFATSKLNSQAGRESDGLTRLHVTDLSFRFRQVHFCFERLRKPQIRGFFGCWVTSATGTLKLWRRSANPGDGGRAGCRG